MRLTDHSGMGDALWFEVGEDLSRFSVNEFCLITGMKCVGSTHFAPIDWKYFAKADNLEEFNVFPWGMLSWEATRAAKCNAVKNRLSSKRIPLKKVDKVHSSIAGFPHALLVWAYESIPTIVGKFTTKYVEAIPRMLSWTSADNVKFYAVMSALIAVGEKQAPRKTPVMQPNTETNFEWREFQKEIRGKIPKQKRSRLSRLGQERSGPMVEIGSPAHAPTKIKIYALPRGLSDEPPREKLEEFKEWINKGLLKNPPPRKRHARYNAKYDTLNKSHDLDSWQLKKQSWFYELTTSLVWLWDEHIDVAFYCLRKKIMHFPELLQRKVNTLLIPMHLESLKHWVLAKVDIMNWTLEVISLFEFKPRKPLGTYLIPIIIMQDIPRQEN
ncbi:hypothetical protein TIFTF001_012512 [Ficus carica]|uniref:DUF1985 domain-containing protein n=1 Tax=Ficus carica TaxID=3494 RepID=A0AA88A2H3_FICCA|nr:hypothetical protein TIFTF001_012512 [Ficus carica]